MKEQLISVEVAILAKEKGFPFNINTTYKIVDIFGISFFGTPLTTQSLLQKWLREVHKFNVTPHFYVKSGWSCRIEPLYHFGSIWTNHFNSYEESLEAGLKEALKLIK